MSSYQIKCSNAGEIDKNNKIVVFKWKMSLSLLLEKYDVSSEEGLQKALNEIEKEEVYHLVSYLNR